MTHTTPKQARSAAEVLDRFTAKKDYADFTFVSQSLRSLADQIEVVTAELTIKDLAIEAMRQAIVRQGTEIAELKAVTAERDAYKLDAQRYRWRRKQYWDTSEFCVVTKPKLNVILGSLFLSDNELDDRVDTAIAKEAK